MVRRFVGFCPDQREFAGFSAQIGAIMRQARGLMIPAIHCSSMRPGDSRQIGGQWDSKALSNLVVKIAPKAVDDVSEARMKGRPVLGNQQADNAPESTNDSGHPKVPAMVTQTPNPTNQVRARRRANPANPTRPEPNSQTAAGMGTSEGGTSVEPSLENWPLLTVEPFQLKSAMWVAK